MRTDLFSDDLCVAFMVLYYPNGTTGRRRSQPGQQVVCGLQVITRSWLKGRCRLPTTAPSEKYGAASNSDPPHNLSPPYFPQHRPNGCCSRAREREVEGGRARQCARETPAGLYISPYRAQQAVVAMLWGAILLLCLIHKHWWVVELNTFRCLFSTWPPLKQSYTVNCPPKNCYSFLLPTSTGLKLAGKGNEM